MGEPSSEFIAAMSQNKGHWHCGWCGKLVAAVNPFKGQKYAIGIDDAVLIFTGYGNVGRFFCGAQCQKLHDDRERAIAGLTRIMESLNAMKKQD